MCAMHLLYACAATFGLRLVLSDALCTFIGG